jgi:MoaA/NifB/PqqE/SkfB family radical SAM enzyme
MSQVENKDLIGFCSAPWTDCITYADGSLKACDRNVASFGNWQELGLKGAWESDAFQKFREDIRSGRYPDKDCASCHNNGTQRTATSSLLGAYAIHYNFLKAFHGGEEMPPLEALHPLLSLKSRNEDSDRALPPYFAFLEQLKHQFSSEYEANSDFRNAIVKLVVIGESLEDYLNGALKPRRVATFRQSQLQAKCTARCVMCAGLYTREIIDGPTLDEKYVDEAFAQIEDVTDFWCNGAEYLFYPGWKKVAKMLADQGVKTRVSTNGILLTEQNIDFLLDNRMLGFLTMSLDAAKKETMETTRVRVNFEKNLARVRYLFEKAYRIGHRFEFTAAFVMMKRNLRELPDFIRLIKAQIPSGYGGLGYVTVLCQPLENFSIDGYRRFVHKEHHSLLGEEELRRIFSEAFEAAKETGIYVSFYNQNLTDFVNQGMPFPKFFPRKMDMDIILDQLEKREQFWEEESIDFNTILLGRKNGVYFSSSRFREFVSNALGANSVFRETLREFPEMAAEVEKRMDSYCEHFLEEYRERAEAFLAGLGSEEKVVGVYRDANSEFEPGDFVLCSQVGGPTRIIHSANGLVLLENGYVVPVLACSSWLPSKFSFYNRVAPRFWQRNQIPILTGKLYFWLNNWKCRLFKDSRSPLLGQVSRFYHRMLRLTGLNVHASATVKSVSSGVGQG